MRILFMGTPEIAATMLRALAAQQEICGVFCQPDKPVGRKQILTAPPVKQLALQLGVPVYQPVKLRDGTAEACIRSLAPDLIAVVAYGRILPKALLDIPPRGCVNIHASLLPQYRGAAPIQRAVENGDAVTGVTAMYMDEGMDTGDIIEMVRVPIGDTDDAASMFDKLGEAGAALLVKTVRAIESGTAVRTPQPADGCTLAPPITKQEGLFGFSDDARRIVNKTRAFCQWPNAYFQIKGKTVKVLRAAHVSETGEAGAVLARDPLTVAARGGAVQLLEVKPEGGRAMTGAQWAAGLRLKIGDRIPTEV
ncbi:MAG: methionyl-tRNA formyltransferase [Oscillospiraceae bacterium]|nr:methionyl-tRNA formyltransferase [Oscillospiraceae bacterium]